MTIRHHARTRLALAATAVLVAATGCGTDDETASPDSRPSAAHDQSIADLLPVDIKESKELRVVTAAGVPPVSFFDKDGQTLVGSDPDLAHALGDVLGVRVTITNIDFDGIIAGLEAGRFDLALAGMFDTVERQAKLTFVDYLDDGYTIGVPEGNPEDIGAVEDLCGRSLAVEKASLAEQLSTDVVATCEQAGDPVEVQPYKDFTTVTQALDSGRAEAAIGAGSVFGYMAKEFHLAVEAVAGYPFGEGTIGVAIPKDDTDLVAAVEAAMTQLLEDGTYTEIFERWGIESAAVDAIRVNEPVS